MNCNDVIICNKPRIMEEVHHVRVSRQGKALSEGQVQLPLIVIVRKTIQKKVKTQTQSFFALGLDLTIDRSKLYAYKCRY